MLVPNHESTRYQPTSHSNERLAAIQAFGGVIAAISGLGTFGLGIFNSIGGDLFGFDPWVGGLIASGCTALGSFLLVRRHYQRNSNEMQKEHVAVLEQYAARDQVKFEKFQADNQRHMEKMQAGFDDVVMRHQEDADRRIRDALAEASAAAAQADENIKLAARKAHRFFHEARYAPLNIMQHYIELFGAMRLSPSEWKARQQVMLNKVILDEMSRLAAIIPPIFQPMMGPNPRLWVAGRLYEDGYYVTKFRQGDYSAVRAESSLRFGKEQGAAGEIRRQMQSNNDCVVFIDDDNNAHIRQNGVNSKLGEDRSIMAGPIHIVRPRHDQTPIREMAMILYLNSSTPCAFNELHKSMFKCVIDTLSMVISTAHLLLDYRMGPRWFEDDQEQGGETDYG